MVPQHSGGWQSGEWHSVQNGLDEDVYQNVLKVFCLMFHPTICYTDCHSAQCHGTLMLTMCHLWSAKIQ
jgi:hypothetical protein